MIILFRKVTLVRTIYGELEKFFGFVFNLNKINLDGFRRLRTSSQLTFESIPQIGFQTYLYVRLRDDEPTRTALGIELEVILFSIAMSLSHAVIEFSVLNTEKHAIKTEFLHYYMSCLNGRFGWVPFEHIYHA